MIDLFDLNQGFFFTLKKLVVQPGKSLRDYIKGQALGFSNPLKLFFIVGAITNFLTFQFSIFNDGSVEEVLFGIPLKDISGYYNYSTKYFSFFTLTAIPFFSFSSWLFFHGKGFNYTENLVFNMYIAVGQFMVLLVFIPLIIFIEGNWISNTYGFFNVLYNVWAVMYFFRVLSFPGAVKSVLAILIPQIAVYFINYGVYRIMPSSFWLFLDKSIG